MLPGYHVADSVLCLFVFFPSMLCYWRGIWDLYGVYLYPDDPLLCDWATFGLGCGALLGYFYQPALGHLLHHVGLQVEGRRTWKGAVVFVLSTRLAMYAHAVTAMAHWRGVWHLANRYIDAVVDRTTGAVVGLVVCYSTLVVFRACHTAIFPPFIVINDMRSDVVVPCTLLQTKLRWRSWRNLLKYTGDCLLTQYVILPLTFVSWRSMLTLYDIILSADDDALKADIISACIGLGLCSICFAIEVPLAKLRMRIQHYQQERRQHHPDASWTECRLNAPLLLMYDDAVCLLVFVCEAFLWRGVWNLNATFLLSDLFLGGWVNHAAGTVVMMTLQLFSYVGICGCARDDHVPSDEDLLRNNYYPTLYLRWFRRNRQATDMGDVTVREGLTSSQAVSPAENSSSPAVTDACAN